MDSKPRQLHFTLSSTTSSYSSPSSFSSSSSSLGANRLYGRGSVLCSDRLRSSSALTPDLTRQTSRFLSSSRDYSSVGGGGSSSSSSSSSIPSRTSPNWKLPSSLSTSSLAYDRSWAGTSLSSRSKLTDSERRLGTYSALSSPAAEDGDSKRAKMSYTNRAATYARIPSATATSSATGASYASARLATGGTDSSWKSYRPPRASSSSSDALWSPRELEKRSDVCGLSSGPRLSSSLYGPDRVTSTYAEGARPKETLYSSSSSSRHSSYLPSSLTRQDSAPRTTSRSTSSSTSTLRSTQQSPPASTTTTTSSFRYSSSSARQEPDPPPAAAPVTQNAPLPRAAPDGRHSSRRLLSRLFSRRSSQDSSSSSSSSSSSGARSFDSAEEVPAGGDGAEARGSEAAQAFAFLRRRRRQDLTPVQENQNQARPGPDAWEAPNSAAAASSASWLAASLRNRCPPLFSRRRREGRDESARSAAQGHDPSAQPPPGGRDHPEEEEDDDDDDEEEEGAVGVVAARSLGVRVDPPEEPRAATQNQRLARYISSTVFRGAGDGGNVMIAVDTTGSARSQPEGQEKDKPAPFRDPEKLRKIQESLLLEDSDEEEGDLCRICQMAEEGASNPLIEPCSCTGSLQYVHQDCIKKWLHSKISSGTNLDAITTCELCKEKLHLNIDNFDVNELHRTHELYRTHELSDYEFISCGLYLVVLLRLCEQRFSDVLGAANDAGFFNLARILHEHMDILGSSYGEEEDEAVDNRPSIDFSDLDDDLEEEY